MPEIGLLDHFNPTQIADVVEMYVQADEPERGLWILNNLPGRFRDFIPDNLKKLRTDILAALVTPHAYMTSDLDAKVDLEHSGDTLLYFLRGILIYREVVRYNANGMVPHIIDVGPGEYFVPLGLKQLGCKFTYWDVAMDQRTGKQAHPALDGYRRPSVPDYVGATQPTPIIFAGLEVIEHLPDENDLAIECARHSYGQTPERIHLSTPMYTYNGKKKDWNKSCGLPHLRTYTPQEFMFKASELWPGYQWEIFPSEVMSLRGCRLDTIDKKPLLGDTDDMNKK